MALAEVLLKSSACCRGADRGHAKRNDPLPEQRRRRAFPRFPLVDHGLPGGADRRCCTNRPGPARGPTDRIILTGRCETTLVGRGRSSDSGSRSRGRPHSPARANTACRCAAARAQATRPSRPAIAPHPATGRPTWPDTGRASRQRSLPRTPTPSHRRVERGPGYRPASSQRGTSSYTWDEPSTASPSCGSCGGSRKVRPPRRVFMQQRRCPASRGLRDVAGGAGTGSGIWSRIT